MTNIEGPPIKDREAIDRWADSWVEEIFIRYQQIVGSISPPIDEQILVTAIEGLRGINIELEERARVTVNEDEGVLLPTRGGFLLRYGLNQYKGKEKILNREARKRFTVCHELAHVLFYDCSGVIPKLTVIPKEDMCHKIARKLLMPEESVRRRFLEEYNPGASIVAFLRKFAKDLKVSLYPLSTRLTEDLSLLRNAIITFWEYKGDRSQPRIYYNNFTPRSRACSELKKALPKYWRQHLYRKAWDEVVKKVVINGEAIRTPLCIEGKRRKEGKIKRIPFYIECETLVDLTVQQSLFKWMNQGWIYDALSIEKFDLNSI